MRIGSRRQLALAAVSGALASATFLVPAVALADQPTVTVSSVAAEAQAVDTPTGGTDCVATCAFLGVHFAWGTGLSGDPWTGGCVSEDGGQLCYPPAPPTSSQWWGFASANLRANPCTATNDGPDCDPPQSGWGVQGVPATSVSVGAPFSMATTYWWNEATVGDSPTILAIGGDVEVTPPGLTPFQFWISQPDDGIAAYHDRMPIVNLETYNLQGQCDPTIQRPGDPPCDDAASLDGAPYTWTEVADGLTWHLNVLGFQDPGNPQGDYTQYVVLPEETAALKAPIMATLTVDTNQTSTALESAAGSTRYGDPLQLTATVSQAPSSAGTVAFQDGGQAIAGCAAQPVDPSTGTATCTTSSLRAGSHTITAAYSGALGFAGSNSGPLTQTVTPVPLTVNAPDATAVYGNVPSSFKARYAGLINGDSAPATPAVCTTTATDASAPGTYPIACSGAQDSDYTIAYGPAGTLTVTKAPTALQAAPASRSLLSVTFSATLTRPDTGAPLAGKTVSFSLAGQRACSATTGSSGVATCSPRGIVIAIGLTTYTASFAGDADYQASNATGRL